MKKYLQSIRYNPSLHTFGRIFFVLTLLLVLPATVYMALTSQDFRQFAASDETDKQIQSLTNDLLTQRTTIQRLGTTQKGDIKQPQGISSLQTQIKVAINIAKQRQDLLLQKMKDNPKRFIELATLSDQIGTFPDSVQPYIERKVQTKDTVSFIHGDDFVNRKANKIYKATNYILYFATSEPIITSPVQASLQGITIGDSLAVQTFSVINKSKASNDVQISQNVTLAVVMLNFSNDQQKPITKDMMNHNVFGPADGDYYPTSVADFYKENSYNKVNITGSVYDWVTLQSSNADCSLNFTNWANEADSLVQQRDHVSLSSFTKVLYILPTPSPFNCPGAGWAESLGGRRLYVLVSPGTTITNTGFRNIITHELGHTFGVMHASTLDCKSKPIDFDTPQNCSISEYGDLYDTMGFGYRHFNANYKRVFGYIGDSNVQVINRSGTYSIAPIEIQTPSIQLLKFRKPNTNENYSIEYRAPIGLDAYSANLFLFAYIKTNGIVLRTWDEGVYSNTKLIDMHPTDSIQWEDFEDAAFDDNQTFYDSVNGIKITQVSHDVNGAQVKVEFTNQPTQIENKTASISYTGGNQADYVLFPDLTGKTKISNQMTLEAWIKPSKPTFGTTIFGRFDGNYPSQSTTASALLYSLFMIQDLNNTTKFLPVFQLKTTAGQESLLSSDGLPTDGNTWTHLAVTVKGNVMTLYVNGVQKDTKTLQGTFTDLANAVYAFATDPYNGPLRTGYFGTIDDVRISKIARDIPTNWANNVYTKPLGVDSNTLALWKFDNTLFDETSNQIDGTAYGTVSYIDGKFSPNANACATLQQQITPLFGKACGDPQYDPRMDVDKNGVININDITWPLNKTADQCTAQFTNTVNPCVTPTPQKPSSKLTVPTLRSIKPVN